MRNVRGYRVFRKQLRHATEPIDLSEGMTRKLLNKHKPGFVRALVCNDGKSLLYRMLALRNWPVMHVDVFFFFRDPRIFFLEFGHSAVVFGRFFPQVQNTFSQNQEFGCCPAWQRGNVRPRPLLQPVKFLRPA